MGKIKIKRFFNKFPYGPIIKNDNFQNDLLENRGGKYIFLNLKIFDIEVKLHARNFIKISRVEINRLGLVYIRS